MAQVSTRFILKIAPLLTVFCFGCGLQEEPGTKKAQSATSSVTSPDAAEADQIQRFCGDCHAMPLPSSFPKSMWYDEVRRGFNFYYDSGRTDLIPPAQVSVTKYFRQLAPESLPMPEQAESPDSPIQFDVTILSRPQNSADNQTSISFVDVRPNDQQGLTDLWLSDMKSGLAFQLADIGESASRAVIEVGKNIRLSYDGVANNPAATRQANLDGNGIDDLLIADLGSFLPEDHDQGKVIWIPDGAASSPRPPITILDHIGRIAEVQVGDFDNDGRQDVVVGEFGWHKTGSLSILMNHVSDAGGITFDRVQLDDRPGTIHAIPTDVNQDGRLDIITLISQEHEKVIAFINTPEGFTKSSVYEAPDPSWGSSGIVLTDFDNDGDPDMLYTNGDSFDSYLIKPYHGVWWLENQGSMPFVAHHLAAMPGVHRAIPEDMDLDGDLDVVVAAMLPADALRGQDVNKLHAVVWLERTSSGEFVRHVIEHGRPDYAAMTVADLDQDGRPDIAVGIFSGDDSRKAELAKIYWNRKSQP